MTHPLTIAADQNKCERTFRPGGDAFRFFIPYKPYKSVVPQSRQAGLFAIEENP